MIINTTLKIDNPEGGAMTVDVEGRFYHGVLEDFYIDTTEPIDDATSEAAIQRLYEEYAVAA